MNSLITVDSNVFRLESTITGLKIPVLLFHVFQPYYVVLQFACTCIMNECCSENVRLSFFGLITMTHTPKVFHQTWIIWGHRGFVEVSLIETSSSENWKKTLMEAEAQWNPKKWNLSLGFSSSERPKTSSERLKTESTMSRESFVLSRSIASQCFGNSWQCYIIVTAERVQN